MDIFLKILGAIALAIILVIVGCALLLPFALIIAILKVFMPILCVIAVIALICMIAGEL